MNREGGAYREGPAGGNGGGARVRRGVVRLRLAIKWAKAQRDDVA